MGQIVRGVDYLLVLVLRGVLLWVFLIPSLPAWLIGLPAWPFAALFGLRVPAGPRYYSRWATYLLDALLTRALPLGRTPWPWQVDMRRSRIASWSAAFRPRLRRRR